jgi:hypothetical protein
MEEVRCTSDIFRVMKRTIEVPAATLRKAKATADVLGIPLRDFVIRAVDEKLVREKQGRSKPWMECAGELAHLHDETMRIQKIIDQEFGHT